jgi:hypothetical protein
MKMGIKKAPLDNQRGFNSNYLVFRGKEKVGHITYAIFRELD